MLGRGAAAHRGDLHVVVGGEAAFVARIRARDAVLPLRQGRLEKNKNYEDRVFNADDGCLKLHGYRTSNPIKQEATGSIF